MRMNTPICCSPRTVRFSPSVTSNSVTFSFIKAKSPISCAPARLALLMPEYANAYDFVNKLPKGLDSFLGEGGTRLSGGQKQRICIARALLKHSKVLIFDESTSALDNISQEHVMESVETLKKDCTIITIAHRLSTIENCDIIYFIDKGKIVDFGTHKHLLRNNKKYSELYHKQKKQKEVLEEDVEIIEDDELQDVVSENE